MNSDKGDGGLKEKEVWGGGGRGGLTFFPEKGGLIREGGLFERGP